MPERCSILLTTLNASFPHAAFGLRYLLANMAELTSRTALTEFTINQRPLDIAEAILARDPVIVGLGIYIWNTAPAMEVISLLKRIRPELIIVLGGPEVSYETEGQDIVRLADYVITGEADLAFRDLCRELVAGRRPGRKIIAAPLPQMDQVALPYSLYTEADLANRVVYVEASRGCPFTCEFCLSSLDIPVRAVGLDRLLPALEDLLERGLRQFKFVDRTFNLNLNTSRALLQFFLDRLRPGLFLHFEMIPDRLPGGLRELIAQFPPGALQFEVGIQTFDEVASQNISRRNHHGRTEENFRYLRGSTGVHIHADLIVGLPGEDVDSFGRGFDRLLAMGPQEIQVGILKRLRGTPIVRHDAAWGMVYAAHPPYEVLQTKLIPFAGMQEMRRFAKYWDLTGNSGNFTGTLEFIIRAEPSAFASLRRLAAWLWAHTGAVDGLALLKLSELVFRWLTEENGLDPREVAPVLWADYTRPGRQGDRPPRWLAPHLPESSRVTPPPVQPGSLPARQARHAGG